MVLAPSGMAHVPPSSPQSRLSPAATTTPVGGPSLELGSALRSIQRRSSERFDDAPTGSSSTTSSTSTTTGFSWNIIKNSSGSGSSSPQQMMTALEADLRLAAQVGQALLEEKAGLEKRLATAETGNQKMLDRLATAVKEAQQLQRRLEETVNNLEQAEANNRALLVSLEEDRKTITRLSSDAGKLIATSASLNSLTRTHEDTLQELISERKRATHAESRVKKAGDRVAEMEERLKRAIQDLEEMRQNTVLRSRKSYEALAKAKAKFASSTETILGSDGTEVAANPEAVELLKLVEGLVSENEMLRSESQELQSLLDTARDGKELSRLPFHAEDDPNEEGEFDGHRIPTELSSNLMSEVLSSPSLSQSASHSFSDFESSLPFSSSSTGTTSLHRSTASHSHRTIDLSRTCSDGSVHAPDEPIRHSSFTPLANSTSRNTNRRFSGTDQMSAVLSAEGLPTPRIPIGRRHHARRAMSIDVTSMSNMINSRRMSVGGTPTSPNMEYGQENRPPSSLSMNGSDLEDTTGFVRPRRHHRPLSLALGPPLFPQVLEDDSAPFQYSSTARNSPRMRTNRSSTPAEVSTPSAPISPTKRRRTLGLSPDGRSALVDSGTQTSPAPVPIIYYPTTSIPRRGSFTSSSRSVSPRLGSGLPRSNTTVSDLSDTDPSPETDHLAPTSSMEMRTAALSGLIDHATRLFTRIQAADIASQENRLKKQHLSGDVRHVALANMKTLVSRNGMHQVHDIEELRAHFRRVLERERSGAGRDAMASKAPGDVASTESMVLRRDFVALVKLFRDLLFELSRLRTLVNRVEVEPHLATNLRELDDPSVIDLVQGRLATPTSSSFLSPLSRFIPSALMPGSEASASTGAPPTLAAPGRKASPAAPIPTTRPAPKQSGVSAVSSATVEVEFGKGGAVRRAAQTDRPGEEETGVEANASPSSAISAHAQGTSGRRTGSQVKRDLNSIFAGASNVPPPSSKPSEPWRLLSRGNPANSTSTSVAGSYNPFNRLLASYRPAMSSTTNAVLDSIPHAPGPKEEGAAPMPTLLERQLRPRGLSDSSIRSTFVAHANPHHRILSPATLALSSDSTSGQVVATPLPIPVIANSIPDTDGASCSRHSLKQQLTDSLLATTPVGRRPSMANLRSQRSTSQFRSVSAPHPSGEEDIPPVPSLPAIIPPPTSIPIKIRRSPSSPSASTPITTSSMIAVPVPASAKDGPSSFLGSLTTWAISKDTGTGVGLVGSWQGQGGFADRERRGMGFH
ncbi:BQ5605_C004g03052 [Microbotryum silenes-dioicae]|uniref:BQ5605_C004g03052 protein n=1 Tax=Microbotryum silenes-dioicae TaxID=796604 RepID=A0A2X0MWP9_9BASI|nr:BQ5605_C004g03052 [Microbotryum silenes-dioicae]